MPSPEADVPEVRKFRFVCSQFCETEGACNPERCDVRETEIQTSSRMYTIGTESVMKTAEKMSMEPANLVSFLVMAAPIGLRLKNRAAGIPKMVIPFDVAGRITKSTVTSPRNAR